MVKKTVHFFSVLSTWITLLKRLLSSNQIEFTPIENNVILIIGFMKDLITY